MMTSRACVLLQPLTQQRFPAVRHRGARGFQGEQRRRTAAVGEHLPPAPLQASAGVLQRAVEHRAALDVDRAERGLPVGDRRAQAEGQPRLAELGCPGEQVQPFAEQAGHGPAGFGEVDGHQLGVGPPGAACRLLGHGRQGANSGHGRFLPDRGQAIRRGRWAPACRPEVMVFSASRAVNCRTPMCRPAAVRSAARTSCSPRAPPATSWPRATAAA